MKKHQTLHEAMNFVLASRGEAWVSAEQIATEIATKDLWRRPSDDMHPMGSQVARRARKYPDLFETDGSLIRRVERREIPRG